MNKISINVDNKDDSSSNINNASIDLTGVSDDNSNGGIVPDNILSSKQVEIDSSPSDVEESNNKEVCITCGSMPCKWCKYGEPAVESIIHVNSVKIGDTESVADMMLD